MVPVEIEKIIWITCLEIVILLHSNTKLLQLFGRQLSWAKVLILLVYSKFYTVRRINQAIPLKNLPKPLCLVLLALLRSAERQCVVLIGFTAKLKEIEVVCNLHMPRVTFKKLSCKKGKGKMEHEAKYYHNLVTHFNQSLMLEMNAKSPIPCLLDWIENGDVQNLGRGLMSHNGYSLERL